MAVRAGSSRTETAAWMQPGARTRRAVMADGYLNASTQAPALQRTTHDAHRCDPRVSVQSRAWRAAPRLPARPGPGIIGPHTNLPETPMRPHRFLAALVAPLALMTGTALA